MPGCVEQPAAVKSIHQRWQKVHFVIAKIVQASRREPVQHAFVSEISEEQHAGPDLWDRPEAQEDSPPYHIGDAAPMLGGLQACPEGNTQHEGQSDSVQE